MVSSIMEEGLVYDIKLSSVGPANVTGSDLSLEPSSLDLAMKLHYLRAVYYFGSQAFEGLTTLKIKEPMFALLNKYPFACGRFRRAESGRPYIKCNDCGVRFVEAKCDKTLDEWLKMKDDIAASEKALVPGHTIGPELSFSPLGFIQFTKFKCGGMSVGLSWAHVLGDAFSVEEFMNMLGRIMSGYEPGPPINLAHTDTKLNAFNGQPKVVEYPLSMKRVDPVGDNWINVTKCKMEAFYFDVNPNKLSELQSKIGQKEADCSTFEALSAVIWHAIAKIRTGKMEPKIVTICTRSDQNRAYGALGNTQIVSLVKADGFVLGEANPSELVAMMKNKAVDERKKIEEVVEKENGLLDCIIYGANLTFVNLENAKFYDLEYGGHKPVRVTYKIDGVGDQGAVLVLPGPNDGDKNVGGRTIVVIVPEDEIAQLKSELKMEGLLA